MAEIAPAPKPRRRPKISAGQERRRHLQFQVSDLEKAVIAENAAGAGMRPAAYVRARALAQPTHHRELVVAMRCLTAEIARIGNNINQLARWANASGGGLPELAVLEDIRADLKSAVADLRAEIAIQRPRRHGASSDAR